VGEKASWAGMVGWAGAVMKQRKRIRPAGPKRSAGPA
jgi:hypothetical protein